MAINDRPVVNSTFYDENGNAAIVDPNGFQYSASPGVAIARGLISGGVISMQGGYVSTSATSIVAVRATTYTEQSANFTATVSSSSANDAAAGTGTRTVKITYYDQTMSGPFTETLTMNGTSNVTATHSNYCFIERIDSITVGSNGTNVGTISIKNGATTVGTIAASDGQTFWAHHYVQAGKTCFIKRLLLGTQGASCGGILRVALPLTANALERQFGGQFRIITAQPQQVYDLEDLPIAGPARITMYVKPDATTANTVQVSLIFYEL